MSVVAGIDFSTHAIDVVLLDETEDTAERFRFELAGATSLHRARAVREALPGVSWWEEQGVYLAAIEYATGRFLKATGPLFRIQGAVLACLPPALEVWELPTSEWKHRFGLKGNATKSEVAVRALDLWSNLTVGAGVPQDAYDAYGLAYAARELNRRALEAA